MSLTESQIMTIVADRVGVEAGGKLRSITWELRAILLDLAKRGGILPYEEDLTATAGQATISLAGKNILVLTDLDIDGGNVLAMGSLADYQKSIEGLDTPSTGEPTKWIIFNGNLYLYDPVPDSAYTVHAFGFALHADSSTPEYSAAWREALVQGVLWKLYSGKLKAIEGAANWAAYHEGQYEKEIQITRRIEPPQPAQIQYRDI